jgi:hypothetical protein
MSTIESMELWSTFPPFYRTYLIEECIIINAPSFWPFLLISHRILWPSLGAVKIELLLLKAFWIKIFPMFSEAGKGGSFLDP